MMQLRKTSRTRRRHRAGLPWDCEEVGVLTGLYADHTDTDLARMLGRSEWAVKGKARNLGLVRNHHTHPGGSVLRNSRAWSQEEVGLLCELHLTMPYEEIAEKLGRTRNAVHLKAKKLGLRKMAFWSQDEDELLREQRSTRAYSQVAETLGRTAGAVNARVTTLGLEPKVRAWVTGEVRSLAQDYGKVSTEVMAANLRRTRFAVLGKACRERITQKRRWSKAEIGKLRSLLSTDTARQIAEEIGRSHGAVRGKIRQLGLSRTRKTAE
ncbi:MAG: hypothetical protein RBS72_10875 [Sedimentisphaerales bacterium]|nr:hypothetical protein [Sedimentisphaerales bacterium]HNY78332.1 hypothetical protein [Sedimentisphaerales bacterium]HOC63580.1 hypothetical protein [Sedimentisphaerales bacterium]HOH62799.1 hypothetical protein [Sedimentisphaerales bacterium]